MPTTVQQALDRLEERRMIYARELEEVSNKLHGRLTYPQINVLERRKAALEALLHEMRETKKTLEALQ